jgi:hypothetical protein
MSASQLSSNQLRQALQLSERIESLQQRLNSILGGGTSSAATTSSTKSATKGSPLKGRKLSPATLRKMRAAQQARWAKIKSDETPSTESAAAKTPAPTGKKKGKLTPEGRARLAAAMKARWAARKKGEAAPVK